MQSLITKQNIVKITPKKPIFYILTSSNLIIFKRLLLPSCLPYQKELKNIFFKIFQISYNKLSLTQTEKTTIFDIHSSHLKISKKFLSPSCPRYRSRLKNIHFIKISLTSTNSLTQLLFFYPKKEPVFWTFHSRTSTFSKNSFTIVFAVPIRNRKHPPPLPHKNHNFFYKENTFPRHTNFIFNFTQRFFKIPKPNIQIKCSSKISLHFTPSTF